MQIDWKIAENESPYLLMQQAKFNGLRVHRARGFTRRLRESAENIHKLNI